MTTAAAPPRLAAAAEVSLRWYPDGPYSLARTLGPLLRGNSDPSFSVQGDVIWNAFTTPAGPATMRLTAAGGGSAGGGSAGGGSAVDIQAWGPGAAAAVQAAPRLLGAEDDWAAFDEPSFRATLPRLVREARRRNTAVRLPSSGRMVDQLVPIILEQKVTVIEARRAYRYLVHRYGTPAPQAGASTPPGLVVAPTAAQWLQVPSWEWHKAGVGPQRSATVMRALRSAVALERLAALPATQ
ncbi:MAG: 3-methyladenine DNA glycosylase, partial [Actinomycetes bacterium]